MSISNCCFLTCIQVSQEAGEVIRYFHLFQNFSQFIVIHTVKGFGIVNKAEIDIVSKSNLQFTIYISLLLLLLLSRFSRVRLCATPQMAAHQAPPSLGFSRQEHWSGLPLPSPMHESEKGK